MPAFGVAWVWGPFLWSLDNLAVHAQRFGLFQSFETKMVVLMVSLVRDGSVQLLWSLDNLAMHTQKVRLFQSFETKIVLLIISLVHDGNVQLSSMCHDKISYCWPPLLVFVFIEHAASIHRA